MTWLNQIKNKRTKVLPIGSRNWEQRSIAILALKDLNQKWNDLQTVSNSWRQWLNDRFHLKEKRIQTIRKTSSFLDKKIEGMAQFLDKSLPGSSNEFNIKRQLLFSLVKGKHVFLQSLDKWITIGYGQKEIQALDKAFLDLMGEQGLLSKIPSIHYGQYYGDDAKMAQAFHGAVDGQQYIEMDQSYKGQLAHFEGIDPSWRRWMAIAHEAGHLEYSNQAIAFSNPDLPQEFNQKFSDYLLASHPSPLGLWLEEMTVDTFAVASILKLSQCSEESLKQAQHYLQDRKSITQESEENFQVYAPYILERMEKEEQKKTSHIHESAEISKEQAKQALLNRMGLHKSKSMAHSGCMLGIEFLLNHIEELKAIPNHQLMAWVRDNTSRIAWNEWNHQTIQFKDRDENHYQVTMKEVIHQAIEDQNQDFPTRYRLFIQNMVEKVLGNQAHLVFETQSSTIFPLIIDKKDPIIPALKSLEEPIRQILKDSQSLLGEDIQLIEKKLKTYQKEQSKDLLEGAYTYLKEPSLNKITDHVLEKLNQIPIYQDIQSLTKQRSDENIHQLDSLFEKAIHNSVKPALNIQENWIDRLQERRKENTQTMAPSAKLEMNR